MAQFDVYRIDAKRLVLDCQSDLLDVLATRLVVPLQPTSAAPPGSSRLNPRFMLNSVTVVMLTEYASAVQLRFLTNKVGSLATEDYAIRAALDVLVSGV